MWIVKIALSRPYTFIVLALVLFLFAPVMLMRTPVDIFPAINVPVVSIVWTDSGLPALEMGSRIASVYKRALTTTVDNIEHIESQSLYGGVPGYLFIPLAEAVIFALLASYFFSRTIVPTLVKFLMRSEVAHRISSSAHKGRFALLHD